MTFTTLTYVLFLWTVFAVYWTLRSRSAQNALLVAVSYVFYGWWDYRFCALMLISTLVDFVVGAALGRTKRPRWRRAWLAASVIANLGMLGIFKYYNFFAENFQAMLATIDWHVEPWTLRIVLPVGISFYTFQTMSYTIDVYRREVEPTRRLVDFMAFVAFFPQLIAGPIERAGRMLPQFLAPRTFDEAKAADGCRQILWGFFKKLVVADWLAACVDPVFGSLDEFTGPQIAFAVICFAFQIYCDFSAYSDIAIGSARLFGFDLMRNFAYPYFSQSVTEFWRRWHISLSTWFRDYVYVPLGGSRTGRRCVVRNILLTFAISGLWHGAAWNFIVWGGLMGLWIVLDVLCQRDSLRVDDTPGGESFLPGLRTTARIMTTFALVSIGWVFFRAATLGDAFIALRTVLFDAARPGAYVPLIESLTTLPGAFALAVLAAVNAAEWLGRREAHPLARLPQTRPIRWCAYTAMLWGTLLVGARETSSFIYFQF